MFGMGTEKCQTTEEKKMKFWTIGMTAAIAGALAIAGVANAQPHGEFGHGPGAMGFLHGITLTDEQKAQVKSIEQASWASLKPLMEKMRTAHEAQVNKLLGAGTVTVDTLKADVAQEESLREQIDAIHTSTMVELRNLLTPEQLAAAASKHAQIEQLHEQEHALMGEPE
jgi:Spy/CpxP family protein refolding chaperone